MTVGYLGNLEHDQIARLPEVSKALERGAVLGEYVLNNNIIIGGIGLWEVTLKG